MSEDGQATFWEHLDELRSCIIRSLGVIIAFAVVAFALKDMLFDVVLAPRSSDFVSYRLLGVEPFSLHLMNTGLTEQFMVHMRVYYMSCFALCPLDSIKMSGRQRRRLWFQPT